jgi:hypothetical protein
MRMGVEIPRGGSLIPFLLGIFCERAVVPSLWDLTDKLSAAEAQSAAKQMEEIESRRVSQADARLEDKRCVQEGYVTGLRTTTMVEVVLGLSLDSRWRPRLCAKDFVSHAMPLMARSKSQFLADYGTFTDSVIARARMPYTAASKSALPPVSKDPVNAALFPVWDETRLHEAEAKMNSRLLTAVFALRVHQAEQGSYPADLSALVRAGYLERVPTDPFSESGDAPLRYSVRENGTYLLYSLGPDGTDDSGTPIRATRGNGVYSDRIKEDSKGDFVVGVNTSAARGQEQAR